MRRLVGVSQLLVVFLFLAPPAGGQQLEPEPVVHALLFYSATCPHCHQLITEVLIPMQEEYGPRLVILGLDTTQPQANDLYWKALRHYGIGQEDWVVPILIVEDQVMVGGGEIPERFPPMVEEGLAGDGIDLPDFPALTSFLQAEGMLDRRFPHRRIALQDPPVGVRSGQADTEGPAASPEEEVPDSVPPAATDTAAGRIPSETGQPDTVPPSQPTPTDTTAAPAPEGAPDRAPGAAGEEAAGAEPGDTTDSPPADTGAPPEEGGERAPEVDSTAEAAPSTGGAPSGGTARSMAQAARELENQTMWDRFNRDRTGNSLSVLVLLFMVVSLILRGYPPGTRGGVWPAWVVPALVVVGVGVAAYLSYIEMTQVEAVCGPVGDCNTVNQSRYAVLFGVLPVGVLGLIGYGVVLLLWAMARFASGALREVGALGAWAAVLFGTLFSVYLTFLEPFVIGATCAWCLTSAVVMTLLLWAMAPLAREAWPGREAGSA